MCYHDAKEEAALLRKEKYIEYTLQGLEKALQALGYGLDRRMDCQSVARYVTGSREGDSYPVTTTDIIELDTRQSAFHYRSRRDDKYKALQAMRMQGAFVLLQDRIFEI